MVDYFLPDQNSLLETNKELWSQGMRDGFGFGEGKMDELRELYKAKAMALGMYYDDEAIMAVYRQGILDAKADQSRPEPSE